VHPDQSLRAVGLLREGVDRVGGGVGGDHGGGRRRTGDVPQQIDLELEVLRNRFEDHVDPLDGFHGGESRLNLLHEVQGRRGQQLGVDLRLDACPQPVLGGVGLLEIRIREHDVEAAQTQQLGDAQAHGASAEDSSPANVGFCRDFRRHCLSPLDAPDRPLAGSPQCVST
jgi:hypothetical protein